MRECERLLSSVLGGISGRLILLPIPTTRDNIYISGTDLTLGSLLPLIDSETTLAGYNIPKSLTEYAVSVGADIFDAGQDENFLLDNARISAKGAFGYLLTSFPRDVADMTIGIVGYGRIGRELLRYLLLFGAEPILFTRRQEVALELGESGVKCRVLGEENDLTSLDILVNTSPSRQIREEELDPKTEIIDLASGNIFEPSAHLTKLSSIPDSSYPITAGRLYAEAILRHLDMEVSL